MTYVLVRCVRYIAELSDAVLCSVARRGVPSEESLTRLTAELAKQTRRANEYRDALLALRLRAQSEPSVKLFPRKTYIEVAGKNTNVIQWCEAHAIVAHIVRDEMVRRGLL